MRQISNHSFTQLFRHLWLNIPTVATQKFEIWLFTRTGPNKRLRSKLS